MSYEGSSVYEDESFFKRYMGRRHRPLSPNEIIEKPVILSLIGEVTGNKILDLGCGDASIAAELFEKGLHSYTGIDGSKNMLAEARQNLAGKNAETLHVPLEDYSFPKAQFDQVISQLVLHYIEDFSSLAQKVYAALKPGGRFIFSVQHPLLTASFKSMTATGKREDWIVDDYFDTGKREEPWIGENVVKYHRTIEDYFSKLQQAGFEILSLKEASPDRQYFDDENEFERRKRIPLFLIFNCAKKTDEIAK